MIRQSSAFVCALIIPAALVAAEKFTIKLNHGSKGDVYLHSKESAQVEHVTIVGPDGNVMEEKKKNTVEMSKYREEILEKQPGKHPTKVKRIYTVATRKVDDDTQNLPYHGKTVLIQLKGETYVFSVDGKELSAEESVDLAKDFDAKKPTGEELDKMLVPNKPVAVGESWALDAKEVVKMFGDAAKVAKMVDASKAKATGKLLKAYKKDGHQFGSMEYKIEVPLKALEGLHPCVDGSKIELTIAGEMCIDGSLTATTGEVTSRFSGTAEIVQDEKKTGVTVKFDVTGKEKGATQPVK